MERRTGSQVSRKAGKDSNWTRPSKQVDIYPVVERRASGQVSQKEDKTLDWQTCWWKL